MSQETVGVVMVLATVLQLLILFYFMSHVGRLQAIQDSTSKSVLLLTVLANRQGATQADIDNALGVTPDAKAKS